MNCDQVFDILTRGPFPTGTPCDVGVEAHLNACPECRRLAEALRPALELFQEAIGPEESRDLPGYWCAVATGRKQPAVSVARTSEPRQEFPQVWTRPKLHKNWSALAAWRMAAMVALGVTVGTLLSARGTFDGIRALPTVVGDSGIEDNSVLVLPPKDPKDKESRFTPAEHKVLASLPAACYRHEPGRAPRYTVRTRQVLATADLSKLNCCSECHNSNSDAVGSRATLAVTQSCQICHNE